MDDTETSEAPLKSPADSEQNDTDGVRSHMETANDASESEAEPIRERGPVVKRRLELDLMEACGGYMSVPLADTAPETNITPCITCTDVVEEVSWL